MVNLTVDNGEKRFDEEGSLAVWAVERGNDNFVTGALGSGGPVAVVELLLGALEDAVGKTRFDRGLVIDAVLRDIEGWRR
jgi:hypothetical protein